MARRTRLNGVLESAAELFSSRGFAATSVRDIAARAEITTAGLYYHVATKEELLFRTCESAVREVVEETRRAVAAAGDPVARIKAILGVHVGYFRDRPHKLVLLNREVHHLSATPRRAIAVLERAYFDIVRQVVRDGKAMGAFKRIDTSLAAFSILSLLNGIDKWYDPAGPLGPQALLDQLGEIILTGIGGGRADV